MFGSAALDVAISLALLYFLLAVLISGLNEFIAGAANARAKSLQIGIRRLLDGTVIVDGTQQKLDLALYGHALIKSLHTRRWFLPGAEPRKPSYIPGHVFRAALEDLLIPADPKAGPRSLRALREGVEKLPEGDAKKALRAIVAEANDDLDRARAGVERWFDDAMERVSGWYKRQVQVILFGIALGLALALNADTLTIANSLAHSPEARAFVVAAAEQVAKQTPPPGAEAGAPSFEKVRATLAQVEDLQIPLGWPTGWVEVGRLLRDPGAGLVKLLGILVTAFAASLGAPFWFDLVNKFVSLRAAGQPPAKTEPESGKAPA